MAYSRRRRQRPFQIKIRENERIVLEIRSAYYGRVCCDINACFQCLFNSNDIGLYFCQSTWQVSFNGQFCNNFVISRRSIVLFPEEELTTSQLVPAFVAAFSVFSILTTFSYVSIVHMNPTVTFALFFAGVFDVKLVIPYIVAQLLGALVGASLAMAGAGYNSVIGAVHLPPHMTSVQLSSLIVSETQLSFLLVFAITMVVANRRWTLPLGSLICAGTVFTGVMCGQLNGAGQLNPARVFGPAILAGDWAQHWVWWVTSLMAAIQSALLHRCVFAQHEQLLPLLRKRIKEPESN